MLSGRHWQESGHFPRVRLYLFICLFMYLFIGSMSLYVSLVLTNYTQKNKIRARISTRAWQRRGQILTLLPHRLHTATSPFAKWATSTTGPCSVYSWYAL